MTEEERVRLHLDLLFSKYVDREPPDALRDIADYFGYIAKRIDYKRGRIEVPTDFLARFESAYLLLRDPLRLYPATVQEQIESISKEVQLERVFAIMAIKSGMETDASEGWSFVESNALADPAIRERLISN